jgi:Transposase
MRGGRINRDQSRSRQAGPREQGQGATAPAGAPPRPPTVRDFGELLSSRLGARLPAWIDAVDASQLPGLTGFALHLLRDLDAVTAGLTLDWSSGSIEGAVNRIKKIKRQLYGRAGFELLPQMILLQ